MSEAPEGFEELVSSFTEDEKVILAVGVVLGTVEVIAHLRQVVALGDMEAVSQLVNDYVEEIRELQAQTLAKENS